MRKTDQEVKAVLQKLLDFIVPPGMTANERAQIAAKAGISVNTLRTNLRRKTINADTLIRLLLARGVQAKALTELPQLDTSKLSKGENNWLILGRQLSETERVEFAELVKFVRTRWNVK